MDTLSLKTRGESTKIKTFNQGFALLLTFSDQQNMRPAAIAQTDQLLPTQAVQLFRSNGALTVSSAQTVTAVQTQHVHLSEDTQISFHMDKPKRIAKRPFIPLPAYKLLKQYTEDPHRQRRHYQFHTSWIGHGGCEQVASLHPLECTGALLYSTGMHLWRVCERGHLHHPR